jgi:hypothetical protein
MICMDLRNSITGLSETRTRLLSRRGQEHWQNYESRTIHLPVSGRPKPMTSRPKDATAWDVHVHRSREES